MRNAYLGTLYDLASKDDRVYALISDNGAIVYDKYRADLPKQYLNLGISEANMLGMAAGMASCGKIPFAYTIGAFLAYRALEFIRNDICIQKQNVKVVGTGAGQVYSALGPTHHTTEDLGALRSMPGLTLICPCSPKEAAKATVAAYEHDGPVYLRLGTNREAEIYAGECPFEIGKGIELRSGTDVSLISTGSIACDVLSAADRLARSGISARVINIHTLSPIDEKIIMRAANETRAVITVEDHNITCGLGSAVAEVMAEHGANAKLRRIGLRDFSTGYGSYAEVKEHNGIGIGSICEAAKKAVC